MSRKIIYVYPFKKGKVSFTYVAETYIETLIKAGYEVTRVEAREVSSVLNHDSNHVVIIHPAVRTILNAPPKFLQKLVRKFKRLVAIDAFDTYPINKLCSPILNQFDLVIVPSRYNKRILESVGVQDVVVIPHYLSRIWIEKPREITDKDFKQLAEVDAFKILFFLWHSWYRKGADVVLYAWEKLTEKFGNRIMLIIKTGNPPCEYTHMFSFYTNVAIIPYQLPTELIIELYDLADLVLVPSRCGAFELNALEGLIREKPVIVSECPCFREYYPNAITIKTKKKVPVFYNNPIEELINNGFGVDPDPLDLVAKVEYIMNHYDSVIKQLRHSFEYAKMFTVDHMSELLLKYISELF